MPKGLWDGSIHLQYLLPELLHQKQFLQLFRCYLCCLQGYFYHKKTDFYNIWRPFLSLIIYVIRADKSPYFRIIVPCIQVVESCLRVIVVPPVAEEIFSQDAVGVDALGCFCHADRSAPQVVFVGANK